MNWKHRAMEAAAGLILVTLPAYSQTNLKARDERVISFIHQANLHEIEAARLAKEKSNSQEVKSFADQMIAYHESADQQVRTYAQEHQVDLDALQQHLMDLSDRRLQDEREVKAVGTATGEWAFTWENANVAKGEAEKNLARLRKLDGAAFDREFVRIMVDNHQRVVDRLVDVRDRGIDPGLRSLIQELLPAVRQHLEMAQGLKEVVSKA